MEDKNQGYANILRYFIAGMPKTSFAAILIALACAFFKSYFSSTAHFVVCIGMLIICGYDIAVGAVRAIIKKRYLHRDVYQTVAIAGTFAIGMYYEAIIAAAVFGICRSVIKTIVDWTEHKYSVKTDQDILLSKKRSPLESTVYNAVNVFSVISLFVIAAFTIVIPLVWRVPFISWMRRAFILFAAACPGAVAIAVGTEYYKCLNAAFVKNIRFKSRASVEKCAKVTSVVFGKIELVSAYKYCIDLIEPAGISKAELMLLAAYACSFSDDELYETVVRESGVDVDLTKVDMYKNLPGRGSAVMLGDVKLVAGTAEMMQELVPNCEHIVTDSYSVYIAANGKYAGRIKLAEASDGAYGTAIRNLSAADIDRVMLLTSAPEAEAKGISEKLGISEVWSGMSFEERLEKLSNLRQMQIDDEKIAFVADSAGDKELVAASDVGVTVGASASVIDADVHIADGDHSKIADVFEMSRRLSASAKRNLIIACVFKIITIFLALLGISGIWFVAVLDTVAMVLVLKGKKGSTYL